MNGYQGTQRYILMVMIARAMKTGSANNTNYHVRLNLNGVSTDVDIGGGDGLWNTITGTVAVPAPDVEYDGYIALQCNYSGANRVHYLGAVSVWEVGHLTL